MVMKYAILSLTCLLGMSLTAAAQKVGGDSAPVRFGNPTGTARPFQNLIYGEVKKITEKEIVLTKTQHGVDQTFQLVKKTKYFRDGKPTTLDSIKEGESVYVRPKKKKKGVVIAERVTTGILATQTR